MDYTAVTRYFITTITN